MSKTVIGIIGVVIAVIVVVGMWNAWWCSSEEIAIGTARTELTC